MPRTAGSTVRHFLLLLLVAPVLGATASRAPGKSPDRVAGVRALLDQGRYAAAADSARLVVEAPAAGDSLALAPLLDVWVEALVRAGRARRPEAVVAAERSLRIREARLPASDPAVALSLASLGSVRLARNEFDSARVVLDRALRIQESTLDSNDVAIAATLSSLGNLDRQTADYAAARPRLERALAIRERKLGPDHPDVATSLGNLGTLEGDQGDYAATRAAYERALAIRERAFGPDHPLIATSCDQLGQVLRVTGEMEAARKVFARGLAIRERTLGPDDPAIAASLQNLGLASRSLGAYPEARAYYERAVGIRERTVGPDDLEYARAINNLANLLRDMEEDAAARPLYEKALSIREKKLGPKHPDVANTLDNYALLLESEGDYRTARGMFERALEIRLAKYGPDHAQVAIAWWSLAGTLERLGETVEARKDYERALAAWEKSLGPKHSDVALALEGLGSVLVDLGEYSEALTASRRSLEIREGALPPGHPKIGESLRQLADVQVLNGDLAGARASVERMEAIFEKTLGDASPSVAEARYRRGRILALEGDLPAGLDAALEAQRIARSHVRVTATGLAEREALRYAAIRPRGQDLAVTVALRSDAAARRRVLDEVVHSRAVVLDEISARHRGSIVTADTLVTRLRVELDRAREALAAVEVRGAPTRTLDSLRADCESAERNLGRVSPRFERELARARIGLDDVVSSLPAKGALVSFVRFRRIELSMARVKESRDATRGAEDRDGYAAFVVRKGSSEPSIVDLGAASTVDRAVARWTERITEAGPERDLRESGAALRRTVWDPIEAAVGNVERVFIVPDGALNLVNLAALPARGGGYLVERGPLLHVASAERDLVRGSAPERGAGLLAVGAVDYDSAPAAVSTEGSVAVAANPGGASIERRRGTALDCPDLATARFEPLPGTGEETRDIVRIWNRNGSARETAVEMRGSDAGETSFKHAVAGRRVVHLATHGFLLGRCGDTPKRRGLGALTSAKPPRTTPPAAAAPAIARPPRTDADNSLRLSGLALAGANLREKASGADDGVLTGEEVASLDLTGVEWVVLSACETATGDVLAGEGVLGVRRAFQVAGAGTLIASLWAVDDAATREWMTELYRAHFERGLDTASAVREASRAVLAHRRARHDGTSPFYWGAFLASGDWH